MERFVVKMDEEYFLRSVSPLLYSRIKNFIMRPGKRVRPILFAAGYLGFAAKSAAGLYTSALSIELLHDFMLVHDDILDKSDTRRGEPSLHCVFDADLKKYKKLKFNGQDLALIAGDVIYAMAVNAFFKIKEDPVRKQKALSRFIRAAVDTGVGEFIELTGELKSLDRTKLKDIYRVYDHKTAYYTFACPLSTGATLAGAAKRQVESLAGYGMRLGRAFQIKDDILGMFSDKAETGKSVLTDLQEAKKTVLVWYAFKNGKPAQRTMIKKLFARKKVNKKDLMIMRDLLKETNALVFAQKEISKLAAEAEILLSSCHIKPFYKKQLKNFSGKLLSA